MIKLANKIALSSLLGAEEGMEKQALNLASLLRMSRNAAKKGKLRRFSELLDKRNLAIDNVAHLRSNAAKQQRTLADIEKALIGNGPENGAYNRLVDRSVVSNGDPVTTNKIIKFRDHELTDETNPMMAHDLYHGVAGPWTLKDLAAYSSKQHPANQIDTLTYPGKNWYDL